MHKLPPIMALVLSVAGVARAEGTRTVDPDAPFFVYEGVVHREIIAPADPAQGKVMRFDRVIDMNGKGYRWDNPGACIRFRTDASEIIAGLNYSDKHISQTGRNGAGVYSVDAVFKKEWSFDCTQKAIPRKPEAVSVRMASGGAAGFHDYALYLPYGDSVDFGGLKVNSEARFEAASEDSPVRYVAYGDSVTQGFSSSGIDKTYPFLLGRQKGWLTFNLGWGGRSSTTADGKLVAEIKPDIVTVLMGGNDWQIGTTLEVYRAHMDGFLNNIRATQGQVPIYLLTPLWVAPSWDPKGKIGDLEGYRQVLREVAAARRDPNLFLIEGPALIDHDVALFDQTPVHPNDRGFAMMVERLATQIHRLPTSAAVAAATSK